MKTWLLCLRREDRGVVVIEYVIEEKETKPEGGYINGWEIIGVWEVE